MQDITTLLLSLCFSLLRNYVIISLAGFLIHYYRTPLKEKNRARRAKAAFCYGLKAGVLGASASFLFILTSVFASYLRDKGDD